MIFRTAILALILAASLAAAPVQAASLCDGLAQGATESLYAPGASLEGIPQAPQQWQVTGCYSGSLHNQRPACQRRDSGGNLNGRFGSCATFSGFSAAVAVARALRLSTPATLSYLPRNIARVYDDYGNPWDTVTPGLGTFTHILSQLTLEMAQNLATDHPQRAKLLNIPKRYIYYSMNRPDQLVGAVATHFNRFTPEQRLPAELILDGWVLDRPASRYCAVRDGQGKCDGNGADMRAVHSVLLVGRRLNQGQCQAYVRNSWSGSCRGGRYNGTTRECDPKTDSLWIPEQELLVGMSAARVEN